jgi:hypothetical protein
LQETRHVDYLTPIFFLSLSAVILRQLPGYENCDRDQQKTGGDSRSAHDLCCIATQVFFANGGTVSHPRCRSKAAEKVALRLWNAPASPNPSRQPNRRRIGFLTDQPPRFVRRKRASPESRRLRTMEHVKEWSHTEAAERTK